MQTNNNNNKIYQISNEFYVITNASEKKDTAL